MHRPLSAAACLPFLLNCTGLDPRCPTTPEATGDTFRVVTFNVGNSDKTGPYALRVRDQAYEDLLAERIGGLDADVVFLQEVLPPTACAQMNETNPEKTCFKPARKPPAQRLLGDEYDIVCDANHHVECVGVHRRFGKIEGVTGFSLDGADTPPLPGKPCDYLKGECKGREATCDSESSVSTVLVTTAKGVVRLIHGHPTAIGVACRQKQIEQAQGMVDAHPVIAAGDWNFDPTQVMDLAPATHWSRWVGQDKRLRSHHPREDDCRFKSTSVSQVAALDRVVSDFGRGRCVVKAAPRLDAGHEALKMTSGPADHYAVVCDLVDTRGEE